MEKSLGIYIYIGLYGNVLTSTDEGMNNLRLVCITDLLVFCAGSVHVRAVAIFF